jgi:hypothetical protein
VISLLVDDDDDDDDRVLRVQHRHDGHNHEFGVYESRAEISLSFVVRGTERRMGGEQRMAATACWTSRRRSWQRSTVLWPVGDVAVQSVLT